MTVLKKRSNQVLLAAIAVAVVAIGAYFVLFAWSSCQDCPTLKYFRLET